MTRPEQATSPLTAESDTDPTGPVAVFAQELRELRRRAGSPPYRAMRAASGISGASLTRAATGRILPTWTVTQGFVLACGGDVSEWEPRWRKAAQAVHGTALVMATWQPPSAPLPQPEPVAQPLRLDDFVRPRRPAPPAVPDPDTVTRYDDLRLALRSLKEAAGFSYADIERNTDGQLNRHSAAAILDGVLPATREQFTLLLGALGLRDDLNRWAHAWYRLDGCGLGAALIAGPAPAPLGRLIPFVLILLLSALTVAVLLLLV